MTAELSVVNNYTKEFKINVPVDSYKKRYEKTLKKTAKKLQLPGFRKGKVPAEFVRKKYHESVHADTLDQLIQDSFREACDKDKVYPLGNLHVEKLDYSEEKGLDYNIKFEVKPELSNIVYTDLKFEQESGEVSDKDVKKSIDKLLFDHSSIKEISDDAKIKKGSYVKVNAQQLDDKKEPMKGHLYKDLSFRIGEGEFDKAVEKELIGLSVGDKKMIDRNYPKNYEIKEMAGKSESYEFDVIEIVERDFPKLDEEFIASLKDEKLKTVEDLEKKTRSNMEKQIESAAEHSLLTNASKVILEKNKIELPQSMVDNYLDRLVEDARKQRGVNEEKFRSARKESAEEELRWQLVREYIQKEEGIELADGEEGEKELDDYIESLSMSEQEKTFFKENDYMRNNLKYQLLNKKFVDMLAQKNTIKKVKLSKN